MAKSLFCLDKKVVLITGGAGYLGRAMTEILLIYGATVYVASRNEKQNEKFIQVLQEQGLTKVYSIIMDVTSTKSVENGVAEIVKMSGTIDILINNAYSGNSSSLLNSSEEEWIEAFDTSIFATYRLVKEVLPLMLRKKQGKIVNLSSMYGLVAPNSKNYPREISVNPPYYGSAKASISQFTKYMASMYAKEGININAIAPGPFPNEDVQKNQEFIDSLKSQNPAHRIGEPKDLQGILLLLVSGASDYINGQTICVDGGWTVW